MALAFLLPVKMMAKASSSDNSTLLWYNAPAQQWLEALPIGNSHLGGMVYGGTTDENIQLNEETFWSGGPHNNNSNFEPHQPDFHPRSSWHALPADGKSAYHHE